MLIDLRDASAPTELDTGVCIAGAGAAGVALARNLVNRGQDVCLLESGGMDFHQATQDLCAGQIVGMEYYELEHSRLRFFGGTTNIWGGRSVPLDRMDFEKRDWVPHSGWPISLDDLQSYYRIAHDSLELGDYDYTHGMWDRLQLAPIDFDPEEIAHQFWRFDAKEERFNSTQVDDLVTAANARIVLHANIVQVQVLPAWPCPGTWCSGVMMFACWKPAAWTSTKVHRTCAPVRMWAWNTTNWSIPG